jgi:hypothetical protein
MAFLQTPVVGVSARLGCDGTGHGMKRRPPPKKRDPVAPALADKLFRQRKVPSKKKYDRKKEKNDD